MMTMIQPIVQILCPIAAMISHLLIHPIPLTDQATDHPVSEAPLSADLELMTTRQSYSHRCRSASLPTVPNALHKCLHEINVRSIET
jgi:hypothetical protein